MNNFSMAIQQYIHIKYSRAGRCDIDEDQESINE